MKTRKKTNCSINTISTIILVILILSEAINGENPNGKYIRRDSQARAREVRGLRPGNLQTARDFGKRNDGFVELRDFHHDRHSKRYPSPWFMERVQKYPRITKKYERIMLNDRKHSKTRLLLESIKIL